MAVVIFGSAARGVAGPDSDVDVLVVAERLPDGRMARVSGFAPVDAAIEPLLRLARQQGVKTWLSPVFKTPEEVVAGSLLFLDMTEDARVLYDRAGFFGAAMARLRRRLAALGARRIWVGNAWYWDLKPGYAPGDVFEV